MVKLKYVYDELTANYFGLCEDKGKFYVVCTNEKPNSEDDWCECEFIFEHQVELIENNLGKITHNIWVAESIEKDEINGRYLFDN